MPSTPGGSDASPGESLPGLLVTDFDGTITRHDFFNLVVAEFAPAHLERYWDDYEAGRLTHFEALAGIFASIRGSEEQMRQLIRRAEPDPQLAEWVERLRQAGWQVVVASAGCAWYIEQILAQAGVTVPVHANPGTFHPQHGLRMTLPTDSPVFSPTLGIDKAALVRRGLSQGRQVAFAGDGYPDVNAARLVPAQRRFARHDLARALQQERLPFRRFERWSEVAQALCQVSLLPPRG